jgi:polysaccharide pyruvyl transferase WcaK-like protein
MKVLLINDSTSNPNWGDRAAAISLKKMISEMGGNITEVISEDDLRYSTFFNSSNSQGKPNHSRTKELIKLLLPSVLLKIGQKLAWYFNKAETRSLIPEKWENFERSVEAILKDRSLYPNLIKVVDTIDIAIIHGDGCMVGNGLLPRTELFLSYILKMHFNKPVIIVNHTADFDHPVLFKMAQEVYPLFDDVVFRDPISVERCKTLCNGRFAADTAFLFKPALPEQWLPVVRRPTYFDIWPDTAQFDPTEPYLCIGGSSAFSWEATPIEIIRDCTQLVKYIQSIYSGQVVLTSSDRIDQSVFRPIAKDLNLPLIGLTTPVQQAVDIIGNAEAYIGGRWHPGIFALRGGAPIIPISSKTFKIQALTSVFNLPSTVYDALNLDQAKVSIGRQLFSYLEQGNGLRDRLRDWAKNASENSWDNISFLRNQNKEY